MPLSTIFPYLLRFLASEISRYGDQLDTSTRIGARIKAVRIRSGLTLRQVSQRSGVPLSTIAKVEKGQKTSADTLVKIARGLGVLFDILVHENVVSDSAGGRHVTDTGESTLHYETALYNYEVHGSRLRPKAMLPLLITVKTRTVPPKDDWSTHAGEEFLYVCRGAIELHTEFYTPTRLDTGESAYFDSKMRHCYRSLTDDDALVLSVCTQDPTSPQPKLPGQCASDDSHDTFPLPSPTE